MTQTNDEGMRIQGAQAPAPEAGPVAGAKWDDAYPPNQSLVPLLIQPMATLGPK